MKTLNQSDSSMINLSRAEMQSVTGGNPWVAFIVGVVFVQALTNPRSTIGSFLEGFEEGFNAARN